MLLEAQGLCLDLPDLSRRPLYGRPPTLRILKDVSIAIDRGETVGLVGESGSGKSSLGRTLLRLHQPSAGTLRFDGRDITYIPRTAMTATCRRMQMIFQDPQSALNPRQTIGRILATPMRLHGVLCDDRVVSELLERVGLPASVAARYPHQLSGGQRQRVGIARAIALKPELIVADEIVSGLDASTQAQILHLLKSLKDEFGMALVFISHDLSVIRHICDRVAIMRSGEIVEAGRTAEIFKAPAHAFTRTLISAIPLPTPDPGWLSRD